jgi:hypothetical protein
MKTLPLALVGLVLLAARPAGRNDPFTLGVLRRDGAVIPFAAFDGSWSAPWPAGLHETELPISIDDIPRKWWGKAGPAREWSRWSDGVQRGTVRLDRPQPLRIMCTTRIGLRSDYRSSEPVPPPFAQPYPKDGLVVSGPQAVDALQMLPLASPEWAEMESTLQRPFDNAEERTLTQITGWSHAYGRKERTRVPIAIEALYRAPIDSGEWLAYYVEAVRKYPPKPEDEGCGLITSVNGWILVKPGGKASFDLGAHVTYCDRKGVTYMLPLGLVRTQGRSYWVYQMSGYRREWYVVAKPSQHAVELRVEYGAGFCSQ